MSKALSRISQLMTLAFVLLAVSSMIKYYGASQYAYIGLGVFTMLAWFYYKGLQVAKREALLAEQEGQPVTLEGESTVVVDDVSYNNAKQAANNNENNS